VFFTGLLAAFSGGYALYTVFHSWLITVLFALLWGAIIFNLDRFLVSSIKKEGSFSKQFALAIPRFMLAAILALVIAKPLELRIFESEILEVLNDKKAEKDQATIAIYEHKVQDHEQKIESLKAETAKSFTLRENNYADYKCECDGTCGTGKRGRGSECERKEQKYLQSHQEYLSIKDENDRLINSIRVEIAATKLASENAITENQEVFSTGLLARLAASRELPSVPSLMITLLILLIEISPVLAKLLAPRGPYDEGLKNLEQSYALQQQANMQKQLQNIQQQQELSQNLKQAELEQEVAQKKKAMQVAADAQLELVRSQINEWLAKEKSKLNRKGQSHSDQ